jgi:hypothetical protein
MLTKAVQWGLQVDSGAVQQTLVLRTGMSTGRQLAHLGQLLQLCPIPAVSPGAFTKHSCPSKESSP